MFDSSIPTCYFPSTVVFIDDSREFLLNFILQLDEHLSYLVFDSPADALSCIHEKRYALDWLNHQQSQPSLLNQQQFDQSLAAVYAELYNPKRFSEISVVVVDYAMPDINGLEFCRQIENSHIKKIVLVGPADEPRAKKALEQGLIHQYINKNGPNLAARIVAAIHELQLSYFHNMSRLISRMLALPTPASHQEPQVRSLFNELCAQHKIVEFYQLDRLGSMVMLDEDARISALHISDESHSSATDTALLSDSESCMSLVVNGYHCTYRPCFVLDGQKREDIVTYHAHLDALDAEQLFLA